MTDVSVRKGKDTRQTQEENIEKRSHLETAKRKPSIKQEGRPREKNLSAS
jgi:hypothetical protein